MLARQVAMARTRLAAAEEEKRSVASVVRELLLQAKRGTTSPDPNEPEPEKKFVSLPQELRHINSLIAAEKEQLAVLSEMRCYLLQDAGFGDQVLTDGELGNAQRPTFSKKRVKEVESWGWVDGYAADGDYYTFTCEPPEPVKMEYTDRELAELMRDEAPDLDSDLEFSDDESDLELEDEEEDEDDPMAQLGARFGAADARRNTDTDYHRGR